jgi:Ni,Fe-hydrogenase I cytochrome b subunit
MENFLVNSYIILIGIFFYLYSRTTKKATETPVERGTRFRFILFAILLVISGIIKFLNDYNMW